MSSVPYKMHKLITLCFAGITIPSTPNAFVNVNPDHIGFYRVNYDSQNWARLGTLLVNNHRVSVMTLTCLVGLLQRSVETAFSANYVFLITLFLFSHRIFQLLTVQGF